MFRRTIAFAALFALSGCSLLPEGQSSGTTSARTSRAPVAISTSSRQCLAELGSAGADFSALPDQYFGSGCSTLNSVKLASLSGDRGEFELANLGPVACPVANAFSGWARYGVDRAARQILGSGLARIETFGSYSCRNVAGTGRRSAHATAEAIDISAFVLENGRRVSVLNGWSNGTAREREFLRVVHQSACKRFGTVLGPEYNAAHRDHFHVESNGGGYCR
jgi:hypothetical protein